MYRVFGWVAVENFSDSFIVRDMFTSWTGSQVGRYKCVHNRAIFVIKFAQAMHQPTFGCFEPSSRMVRHQVDNLRWPCLIS